MDIRALHSWPHTPEEALHIQAELGHKLVLVWDGRTVHTICGMDFSYSSTTLCAAIVVCHYPELDPIETISATAQPDFPYIPGLLAFRLIPAIIFAWEKLTTRPDILMVHGHGSAHPLGIGLASHLGLWLDRPSVGVAKSRLYGIPPEVGAAKGDWGELRDEADPGMTIGAVVRTHPPARPIYVSSGHLIDLEHAVKFVLACCHGYRLPEPLRMAHRAAVNALSSVSGYRLRTES